MFKEGDHKKKPEEAISFTEKHNEVYEMLADDICGEEFLELSVGPLCPINWI